MAEGTRVQRGAIVFGEEVIGTRNVDTAGVRHWLVNWTPPDLSKKTLDRYRCDLLFPIRVPLKAADATGWPLVGRRPDNSFSSRDERKAVLKVAKPIASAVAISRTRETRERESAEATQCLQEMVMYAGAARAIGTIKAGDEQTADLGTLKAWT